MEDDSAPLPAWLAHTFLALDKEHPLRSLLPKDVHESSPQTNVSHRRRSSQPLHITSPLPPLYEVDKVDSVFAFGPPEQGSPMQTDTHHTSRNLETYKTKVLSPNCIREDDSLEYQTSNTHLGFASALGVASPCNLNSAFIPFTKPGPCSTLAPALNQTPLPLLFNIPPIPDAPEADDSGPTYDDMNVLSPSQMLDDHSNPPLCAPYDGYAYNMDYEDDLMEENTYVDGMDSIPSSDTPGPSSDTLTNLQSSLFATPGPGYRTDPVYFDSPAEDPSNSDPLDESEYRLDWCDISFHWKPFLRGHNGEEANDDTKPKPLPIPISVLSGIPPPYNRQSSVTNQVETPSSVRCPADQQRATPSVQPQSPPPETPLKSLLEQDLVTYDLFVQELDAPQTPMKPLCTDSQEFQDFQDYPSSQQSLAAPDSPFAQASPEEDCGRITPESELGPVFAPAPGIYISPLRDADSSDSESQVDQLDESVADADEPRSQPQPQAKPIVRLLSVAYSWPFP